MQQSFKIFNIEFNKTGTTSLTQAMQILGFKSVHFCLGEKQLYNLLQENQKNQRYLLEGLEDFDFFSDFGGSGFYKELDRQYPGSKFILTIRELESWLDSKINQIKQLRSSAELSRKPFLLDRLYWKRKQKAILLEIQSYFIDRPNDLLILNICGGDQWEKICSFLDKPIPEIAFPHKNKTSRD